MTTTLQPVSVKLRVGDLRRIPTENRSEFIRDAVSEKLARMKKTGWVPRTATGRKLAALRGRFVEAGGELLDADDIARELRERRGGLA
jgi:Arc/MetJ-type ribon-helix-helix transcriptional regulator